MLLLGTKFSTVDEFSDWSTTSLGLLWANEFPIFPNSTIFIRKISDSVSLELFFIKIIYTDRCYSKEYYSRPTYNTI